MELRINRVRINRAFLHWKDRKLAKICQKVWIKWNFELTVFELAVSNLYCAVTYRPPSRKLASCVSIMLMCHLCSPSAQRRKGIPSLCWMIPTFIENSMGEYLKITRKLWSVYSIWCIVYIINTRYRKDQFNQGSVDHLPSLTCIP